MELASINPYIRVAMQSVILPHKRILRRVIYDFELIVVESGSFELHYNGNLYTCKKGDVILLEPGIPHSFLIGDEPLSQPHIHFDLTHRPDSARIPVSFKDLCDMNETERSWIHPNPFAGQRETPFVFLKDVEAFLALFYAIVTSPKEKNALMKKGLLIQILSMILQENFPALDETDSKRTDIQLVKDYIDAGDGFDMDLDAFAKLFSYSKFHLDKKFKSAFGMGIIEYRNRRRMLLAKEYLKDHSVTRVSELLGYQSIYSFSRAYKTFYGVSPTASIT